MHGQALRVVSGPGVHPGRLSRGGQRRAPPAAGCPARGLGAEQEPAVSAPLLPGGQILAADPPPACSPGSVSALHGRPLAWRLPALHGPALSCRTTTSPRDQLLVLVMGRTPS